MNKILYQSILRMIDDIKLKIKVVDYSLLCSKLGYTEEELGDYIINPRYDASLYLEILDTIDSLLEGDNNE